MTILLIVLAIFGALIIGFLVFTRLGKKNFYVERSLVIYKPIGEVFNHLKHIKNHDAFNNLSAWDTGTKKEYRGIDGEMGFVCYWKGSWAVGAGRQEIKKIERNKFLHIEVKTRRPYPGKVQCYFVTDAIGLSATRISWSLRSRMTYPTNIVLHFMDMNDVLGPDLEMSLLRLKAILEKNVDTTVPVKEHYYAEYR